MTDVKCGCTWCKHNLIGYCNQGEITIRQRSEELVKCLNAEEKQL
jgi:hypothetical protein